MTGYAFMRNFLLFAVLCAASMATGVAADGPAKPLSLPPAALKLPYQAPAKHLGVATCSSSVCHGNIKSTGSYNVQLNEYVTWSHDDAHS